MKLVGDLLAFPVFQVMAVLTAGGLVVLLGCGAKRFPATMASLFTLTTIMGTFAMAR